MHRRSSYLEVLPTSCTLKFYCWQKRQNVQIEQIAFKFYQHLVSSSSTNILYLQVLLLTEETECTDRTNYLLALKFHRSIDDRMHRRSSYLEVLLITEENVINSESSYFGNCCLCDDQMGPPSIHLRPFGWLTLGRSGNFVFSTGMRNFRRTRELQVLQVQSVQCVFKDHKHVGLENSLYLDRYG